MNFRPMILLAVALGGGLVGCEPAAERPAARQRQMYGLVQKFDRYDDNGDGYLTRKELDRGVRNTGTLKLTAAQLDQAMKGYDRNGDRRISQREAQLGAENGPDIFADQ